MDEACQRVVELGERLKSVGALLERRLAGLVRAVILGWLVVDEVEVLLG